MERRRQFHSVAAAGALIIALCTLAGAQYGGGTGTPDDPYLIYTPEQMNAIGADPNDWDKHFKLMADLDLSQYTGTEFNLIGILHQRRAVYSAIPFTGVFDGNGHAISNFSYTGAGEDSVGLFRYIDDPNAQVINLGLINPEVDPGYGSNVGALVGHIEQGRIAHCYVAGGAVAGGYRVGGLVGDIGYSTWPERSLVAITDCHCTCDVVGKSYVGGLVGASERTVSNNSATGVVTGNDHVGGLVGYGFMMTGCYADCIVIGATNTGNPEEGQYLGGLAGAGDRIVNCYAQGIVIGTAHVGGLAGRANSAANCYATALVRGTAYTGGLIGPERYNDDDYDDVVASFWDVQTSRQDVSAGGRGRTTTEMQQLVTFLPWGQGDNAGVWTIDEGSDYPRLAWENRPGTPIASAGSSGWFAGSGTPDDPYLIYTAGQMDLIGQLPDQWDKHYRLMADIDLASYGGSEFHLIGVSSAYPFEGSFDGNGHAISNFTYASDEEEEDDIGLFRYVRNRHCRNQEEDCFEEQSGTIKNLGLIDPDVNAQSARFVGALVGDFKGRTITNCHVRGGTVSGEPDPESFAGGLVGVCDESSISACYSSAVVTGGTTGGLVGYCREGAVRDCYATGTVIGGSIAGGLVGYDYHSDIAHCYATGLVVGLDETGGLAGHSDTAQTATSFWDVETSGLTTSAGGTGLTTHEMMTAAPFLAAGWDFVGEVENGAEEIWWIEEGVDTPRLWWERPEGEF